MYHGCSFRYLLARNLLSLGVDTSYRVDILHLQKFLFLLASWRYVPSLMDKEYSCVFNMRVCTLRDYKNKYDILTLVHCKQISYKISYRRRSLSMFSRVRLI